LIVVVLVEGERKENETKRETWERAGKASRRVEQIGEIRGIRISARRN
jgi:hypothetical protein